MWRSRCGGDETWNQVGLCAWCHLRGVHGGYLRVEGRAGELLLWDFGKGEIWHTRGNDDVARGPPP